MDDDLQQLEAELKRLRPAAPSARLRARMGEALVSAHPQSSPRGWWLWGVALPAAAAIAVMAFWPKETPRARNPQPVAAADRDRNAIRTDSSDTLKPVVVENVLYAAHDEGLVTLSDGTPARRQRLNYVDTVTWKNPHTNISLTWSVPREEVRVTPVVFQ